MKKDEILDLVIKAFGIYVFVLFITELASAAEAATKQFFLSSLVIPQGSPDLLSQTMSTSFNLMNKSQIPESLVKAAIYFFVAFNFLTTGSWIRAIIKRGKSAEPPVGGDGKPAPQP